MVHIVNSKAINLTKDPGSAIFHMSKYFTWAQGIGCSPFCIAESPSLPYCGLRKFKRKSLLTVPYKFSLGFLCGIHIHVLHLIAKSSVDWMEIILSDLSSYSKEWLTHLGDLSLWASEVAELEAAELELLDSELTRILVALLRGRAFAFALLLGWKTKIIILNKN